MKFQVSVLSDKGVKKVVLTVDADRYEEITREEDKLLFTLQTRIRFYTEPSYWFGQGALVATALMGGSYVVEQVVA